MENTCRLCGSSHISPVIDLGELPIGHNLRLDPDQEESLYPLTFDHCAQCGLLQISNPLPAHILYEEAETYTTSFQNPPHLADVRATLLAHGANDPVVEIACNDGLFLQLLSDGGIDGPIGIEPNPTAAELARNRGFTVETDYLTPKTAERLVAAHGNFAAAVARHVVEHIDDLKAFFSALRLLLTDDGLFYIELPRLEPSLECGNPSVLWEEHLSYFSEPNIDSLLALYGFEIIERRHYAFGGGTIGLLARPAKTKVAPWNPGELDRRRFLDFANRIDLYAATLRELMEAYRAAGWRIAIYGAAPRSSTVINHAKAGGLLDLVVDDREEIQGRHFPGTKLPVTPFSALDDSKTLFLMAVGSENEHKVRRKITAGFGEQARFASLFTPRDAVASMQKLTLNGSPVT